MSRLPRANELHRLEPRQKLYNDQECCATGFLGGGDETHVTPSTEAHTGKTLRQSRLSKSGCNNGLAIGCERHCYNPFGSRTPSGATGSR